MKRKNKFAVLLTLCTSIYTGSALSETPSYNYLQLGYVAGDYADLAPFNLNGFELEGSYDLGNQFFISGKYRLSDDTYHGDHFDETNWQAGLGYQFNYSANTVFDARVAYGDIRIELYNQANSFDVSTHYYSLAGNVRHQLLDNVEVYGGLEWQFWNLGSDQKAYRLGSQYTFEQNKAFSVGIEYNKNSDSQWGKLFVRYTF